MVISLPTTVQPDVGLIWVPFLVRVAGWGKHNPSDTIDMKITVNVNISYHIQYLLYLAPIVTNLFLVYRTGSHCKC